MKSIFFIILTIFFTACSISNESLNSLNLKLQPKYTFDRCSLGSYTSKANDEVNGRLFVEKISLADNCEWNGFQRGYFEDLFRNALKIKSMRVIERLEYSNYEFTTYLIDDKYYINLIYKYSFLDDLFILDYDGLYYEKQLRKYDNKYVNKYKNELRFDKSYDNSLVNKNIINGYFKKVIKIYR